MLMYITLQVHEGSIVLLGVFFSLYYCISQGYKRFSSTLKNYVSIVSNLSLC